MKKIKVIQDKKVFLVLACEDILCKSAKKEISIHPDWLQDNGTPTCECGQDMTYIRTEIEE